MEVNLRPLTSRWRWLRLKKGNQLLRWSNTSNISAQLIAQHCCVAGWCVLLNILPCTGQFITQQNSFLQGVIWCCRKLNRLLLSTTKFWFIARITTTPTCHATKLEENGSDWFFHVHIKLTCDEFVRANPDVAKKHKQTMAERKPRVLTPVGGSWCKSSCYPLSHVYLLFLGNFFCRFQPPPPKKKNCESTACFLFYSKLATDIMFVYRSRFTVRACMKLTNQMRGMKSTNTTCNNEFCWATNWPSTW